MEQKSFYTLENNARTLNQYLCMTIVSFEVRDGNFINQHFKMKNYIRKKNIKDILTVGKGKKSNFTLLQIILK